MNHKEIIALLMVLPGGMSLCNDAWDWFLYLGGLLWACLGGIWGKED